MTRKSIASFLRSNGNIPWSWYRSIINVTLSGRRLRNFIECSGIHCPLGWMVAEVTLEWRWDLFFDHICKVGFVWLPSLQSYNFCRRSVFTCSWCVFCFSVNLRINIHLHTNQCRQCGYWALFDLKQWRSPEQVWRGAKFPLYDNRSEIPFPLLIFQTFARSFWYDSEPHFLSFVRRTTNILFVRKDSWFFKIRLQWKYPSRSLKK